MVRHHHKHYRRSWLHRKEEIKQIINVSRSGSQKFALPRWTMTFPAFRKWGRRKCKGQSTQIKPIGVCEATIEYDTIYECNVSRQHYESGMCSRTVLSRPRLRLEVFEAKAMVKASELWGQGYSTRTLDVTRRNKEVNGTNNGGHFDANAVTHILQSKAKIFKKRTVAI